MDKLTKKDQSQARTALLQAAEHLFVERGYPGVGTREIAESADVNLGLIQYYFGSKAHLFVEVVREVMRERPEGDPVLVFQKAATTREEAAEQLCRFINTLMQSIAEPRGHGMCKIMFREVLSETALDPQLKSAVVESAVKEWIAPVLEKLFQVLRIFDPELDERKTELLAHCIVGQCTFYFTHEPFIAHIHGSTYLEPPERDYVVENICRFSLRGLKCDDDLIEQTLKNVFKNAATVRNN